MSSSEKETTSAKKTLKEVIEGFEKAKKKADSVRENEFRFNQFQVSQEETEADAGFAHTNCLICNKSIGSYEFIMCLECCGTPAHVTCIAEQKIQKCPTCNLPISESLCATCKKLSKYVPEEE